MHANRLLQDDGLHVADTLENLAIFTANVVRRYAAAPLQPLLTYLTHSLRSGGHVDLVLLKCIL